MDLRTDRTPGAGRRPAQPAAPRAAAGRAPSGAAPPLAGQRARTRGGSPALRIAVQRLRALGCAVEESGDPPPREAPTGWIGLTGPPFASHGAAPECRISWSGPVAVPLHGESDVQAACGIAHVHGRAVGAPRTLGVDFASVCAGVLAAQSVTAAALARARGGAALSVTTSVAQAALLSLTQYVAAATAPTTDAGPGAVARPAPRHGARSTPPFRSADGVLFELETLDADAWWRLWTRLGASSGAVAAGWPAFQQRFATATCALPAALGDTVAALDFAHVLDAARETGVSAVAVRGADAPDGPAPDSPWRLRAHGGPSTGETLPPLAPGERAPLAGLRVVEATTRVQGPLAGHLLGLLGAEVVRVEPPGGDPMRGVPPMAGPYSARFLALNRGKDAVEADLKTDRGRRTARELIASAHVFLHNWPPGRADRLGLGPDVLAADHPSLVHVHTGGWADALPAPQPLGTDFLVQAHSGVAALVNGPGGPAAPSLMTITDVLGGIIGAEGAVAALLALARTGTGVRSETALVDAARLLRASAHPRDPAPPTGGVRGSRTGDTTGNGDAFGKGHAAGNGDTTGNGDAAAPRRRAGDRSAGASVTVDLAAMAADPAFAPAFETGAAAGTAFSRAPWTFEPAAGRPAKEAS
ncbi:CoA transferase [Nocardiopsis aegyptia]|uniref:Crotonobetainyl-CoA:carnitine CoA-transferase CaiB-like acyl-CoA transferase n=1 Tax=Nocardiopsis aegyptia TaxID=220378 RepID=A0A7Z0EKV7_9ACTN|nr:CoA transferase [Nocardiopsis aegyptia]NYJ33178.1 crotonobetainyl-CoA:carnitine CoA-transferase CaiB-like acyl-CoA transferase [Nocardiopsis aegyptia]